MLKLDKHIQIDKKAVEASNLTDRFEKVDLDRIGNYAWDGYDQDQRSRANWLDRNQAGMDLALQVVKGKSFPWPNASNVAFPLVTIAALQFHSRSYPALINGKEVVKCRVIGDDPDGKKGERAKRVACHMSYQVLEEDPQWEEGHDRLLINVPIVGCAFVKTRFSNEKGHNCSELVLAKDLVLDYFAKSVETARRKTQILRKYKNEIYAGVKTEAYRDVLDEAWYKESAQIPVNHDRTEEDRTGFVEPMPDGETPYTFLEQHCWMDLDGDGFAEPYVVLLEEESHCVVRLTLRIDREEDIQRLKDGTIIGFRTVEAFTKYELIPAPDGGVYGMGFGLLLGPLNHSVNTLINQLIDAGTMSNTAGGFLGRGAKIRGGTYTFAPLEWKRVDSTGDDLRKNIVPLTVREPSNVLYQLLNLLIDYTNRISGATEMLAGENPGQNTAASTTDHMVEQGMKVYAAIFKRCWRSMKEEFKKLYILNTINLSSTADYYGGTATREDYLGNPKDVCPAADPNIVSDNIRFGQARLIAERAQMVAGYDQKKVELNLLKAAGIDDYESYFPGVEVTGQPEDVKITIERMRIEAKKLELQNNVQQFAINMMEQHELNNAKISQLQAQATESLANAQGEETYQQIAAINAQIALEKDNNSKLENRLKVLLEGIRLDHEMDNAEKDRVLEKERLRIEMIKAKKPTTAAK